MSKTEKATIAKGPDGLYLKDFYTPLSVAKEEIWRRWNDEKLRKKVEKFLNYNIPKPFKSSPKATLFRHIITPNFELCYFLDIAKLVKLEPALLQYSKDRFVTTNPDKYRLCKLFLLEKNNKIEVNEQQFRTVKIINFNDYEGKKINLSDVKTIWGGDLVSFHKSMLEKTKNKKIIKNIFDISDWFIAMNNKTNKELRYLRFLSLFLCHGILFDNFLDNKQEKKFFKNRFIPSITKLKKIFNINPIITPLVPLNGEKDNYWQCYNQNLLTEKQIMPNEKILHKIKPHSK